MCDHMGFCAPPDLRPGLRAVSASRVPHVFHMGLCVPPDLRPGLRDASEMRQDAEPHVECNGTWGDNKTYNLERIGDARENIYRSGVGEDVEVVGDVAVDTLLPGEPGCVFAQSVGHGGIGIGHVGAYGIGHDFR